MQWNITSRGVDIAALKAAFAADIAAEAFAPHDGRLEASAAPLIDKLPAGHPKGYWVSSNGVVDDTTGKGSMALMAGTTS